MRTETSVRDDTSSAVHTLFLTHRCTVAGTITFQTENYSPAVNAIVTCQPVTRTFITEENIPRLSFNSLTTDLQFKV